MILLSIIASLAAITAEPAPPQRSTADLRQTIWSACNDLPPVPSSEPPSPGWVRACDVRRGPVLATLWRIGTGGAPGQRIDALELVAAWAPPPLARGALGRLVSTYRDADALTPAIKAGFQESRSPNKRSQLLVLARKSRSRAVVGAATYLLAAETLGRRGATSAERRQAIASVRLATRPTAIGPPSCSVPATRRASAVSLRRSCSAPSGCVRAQSCR